MTVTSRLGYRYLWVDRLCIIQDNDAHRRLHLASMAAIYANASITIIAASSRPMKGGMLYGLPELFFEGMMPWQPREPLLRR
jgi:hypothetical protein